MSATDNPTTLATEVVINTVGYFVQMIEPRMLPTGGLNTAAVILVRAAHRLGCLDDLRRAVEVLSPTGIGYR